MKRNNKRRYNKGIPCGVDRMDKELLSEIKLYYSLTNSIEATAKAYHDDAHGWWSVVNSIATIKQVPSSTFGLNNISFKKDDDNETYYATWEFIGNGLDSYQVKWSYKTKNTAGRYIEGSSSTIDPDSKAVSSYTPPSDVPPLASSDTSHMQCRHDSQSHKGADPG